MLSIESLTLARYAEVTQDGLLNVMGAGWNSAEVRSDVDAGPAKFSVAATVLCVDVAEAQFDVVCRLYDPAGEVTAQVTATVVTKWESKVEHVARIPLAFEMAGVITDVGEWRVELSTADDMRAVTFVSKV